LATYQYNKLNLTTYISQLYKDGLSKSEHLNDNEIEEFIYNMGIFKFKGYVRAFKFNLSLYTIDDVLFLYLFDKFLSKEILGLCLTFESKLKSILVEECYNHTDNPFFYLLKSNYITDEFYLKKEILDNWKIRSRPNNEGYKHYHDYYLHTYEFVANKEKYLQEKALVSDTIETNFPPFHYLTESATFGIIKVLINNLSINNQHISDIIARKFGFYQSKKFKSYLERINEIRNRCAHNGRIFNRTYRSVTAIGKYKSFRNENTSVHSIIDVYLTLYFLLGRLDSFSSYEDFYSQVIDRLFNEILNDFEISILSKKLLHKYDNDTYKKMKNFITKGMA